MVHGHDPPACATSLCPLNLLMLNLKYILHLGLWDQRVYITWWLDGSNVSQFTVVSFWPMITYWAMVRCSVSIKLHQYINGKHCEWYLAMFCLQTCLALWVVSLLVRRPTHFPFFFYFSHFNCFLFEVLKRNKTEKATNVIKCTVQNCPFGISQVLRKEKTSVTLNQTKKSPLASLWN
jgi:hypothetical protein